MTILFLRERATNISVDVQASKIEVLYAANEADDSGLFTLTGLSISASLTNYGYEEFKNIDAFSLKFLLVLVSWNSFLVEFCLHNLFWCGKVWGSVCLLFTFFTQFFVLLKGVIIF